MRSDNSATPEELGARLSPYLPVDRRLAIAQGRQLPDRAQGAALFVDVSGFTPLTAVLTQTLGTQRGAEVLTNQLNEVYGALIALVHRYRGSVVGFAGDSLTCWFDDEGHQIGDPTLSTRLAATCGLAMQQAIVQRAGDVAGTGTSVPISLKVAVAAGSVRRFQLGQPQYRLVDTLAGSTLDRLAAAEQLTRQGEVVLDRPALHKLGNWVGEWSWRGEPDGEGVAVLASLEPPADPMPWPEVPSLNKELVKDWLLKPVLQHLERGEGEFLSELRLVASLFIRFRGPDYDHEDDASQKLDAYVGWVQSVIWRYQGYLMELVIGDKGSYLQVAFGAPVAYGDEATRAVAAALELRYPPASIKFIHTIQIGVSQGIMRAGAYGSASRRTYGVHGNPVNIAARLMTIARPGQILVTEPIAQAAVKVSEFREVGARPVKGLEEPVMMYEAIGRMARKGLLQNRPKTTTIVGRRAELARIEIQLQKLLDGQSGNAVIVGEQGIGKTQLRDEIEAQARKMKIPVLIGAANRVEQSTPYHAWWPVFYELLGVTETDDPATVRETVTAYLDGDEALIARLPLLNSILPLAAPESELTAALSGEVRASNTGDLLVHLLKQGKDASAPLVIILDDAHWLDSASWALLDKARREMETLLLIILLRPLPSGENGQAPPEYTKLLPLAETDHYRLGAMSPDEIVTLVNRKLGAQRLPQPVQELILERAEGHPFFSEEIALALRDTGLLKVENGQANLVAEADLRQINFPTTIQEIIISRIDRLEPGQQLTLKVASVIGRQFFYRTLKEIYPLESDQPYLLVYLRILADLNITPVKSEKPELTYIFRHAITHEAVYGLLLYRQRRQLHQAVAKWYEETYPDDVARHAPLLAYHWRQANDISKTMPYLEQAADQALRDFANREAAEFLRDALNLAQERYQILRTMYGSDYDLKRSRWLRQLGEAYLGLGQMTKSRVTLLRMLSLIDRPSPGSMVKLLGSVFKEAAVQVGHRLRPERAVRRATGPAAATSLEAVRAYQHLAEIYYFANERSRTLHASLNALNLSERVGPCPELARAYANMIVVCGLIPWHSAANTYSQMALEMAEQVGEPSALAWANILVGTYQVAQGGWERVLEVCRRADAICRRTGNHHLLGLNLGVTTLAYYLTGNFEKSRAIYAEWHQVALNSGNIQHQTFGLFGQAENVLPGGGLEEAIAMAERGLQLLEETELTVENRTSEIRGYGILAAARLRAGEGEAAWEAANRGLRVTEQFMAPTAVTLLEGLSGLAEVYLGLWAQEAARSPEVSPKLLRRSAKSAVRELRQYGRLFAVGRPRAHLWGGYYDELSGKPERARQTWQKGLALAEKLGMPFEQGRISEALGRQATGAERDKWLRQAAHIYESLGASYYLDQVEALLTPAPHSESEPLPVA